ncbi:uncharacterized protein LOC112091720 [Morus notabilis]|uniref:uncharacterized protein LOC112091720 n=1 Tax=Morus notabilis TaxID=981085 RepID=UPI000CED432C|nr:uncharacterized protein LOC112091720 [Morus notabilis]
MEVYVDDMLVKSRRSKDHVGDLKGMFDVLRKYRMKLNPLKCAFGVKSGKFLGFMVNSQGIKANPEKVQALLDMKLPRKQKEVQKLTGCIVALNRSSNDNGSGAGLVLHTPEGHKITSAVRFEFPASNNEAEYEALLARLRLVEHLKAGAIDIFSDSQLVVNQVKGQYQTKDEKMAAYLEKVKEALGKFWAYDIQQVPRAKNSNTDALARLATSKETKPSWKDPIIRYLLDGELPEDKQ